MIKKPMLAVNADLSNIKYPVLATPKFDGIRCLKINGQCVTRTFKPIPNPHVRAMIEKYLPDNVDGEIICGNFQETTSAVMRRTGEPEFIYNVFDYVKNSLVKPYEDRMKDLTDLAWAVQKIEGSGHIRFVLPEIVGDRDALNKIEEWYINRGYEGVMIRAFGSPYKCGRSTINDGYLLKIKRFEDAEAQIIGFEELMHNDNELKKDALGYADRSTSKEGLVPKGILGSLLVKDLETGIEFKIGSGFTEEMRKHLWDLRQSYLNKLVKYKHQPSGKKDAPRFPVFIGIRDERDC